MGNVQDFEEYAKKILRLEVHVYLFEDACVNLKENCFPYIKGE